MFAELVGVEACLVQRRFDRHECSSREASAKSSYSSELPQRCVNRRWPESSAGASEASKEVCNFNI